MTVVEHDAMGQPGDSHALPFKFAMLLPAFKGVDAVAAGEGLCNPSGFVIVDKHQRSDQSHAIATRVRPALQAIGLRHGANIKVVAVPPGPPVLSPLVADIYGPEADGRRQVAKAVRGVFAKTAGVVDIDDSSIAVAPRTLLLVDRRKAAMLGVSQQEIVTTLRAGLAGEGRDGPPAQESTGHHLNTCQLQPDVLPQPSQT